MVNFRLVCAFLGLFGLTSCGPMMKTLVGLKNPQVQSKAEVNTYFKDVLPDEPTYFLTVEKVGDSASIYRNLLLGFSSEMKLFDQKGTRYCYQGTEECSGVQMTQAFASFENNYKPCLYDDIANGETLDDYLNLMVDVHGQRITKADLPVAHYYIIQNWNTYSGSKKRFREDVQWLSTLRKDSTTNIAVLFINGDLLVDWGLIEGEELQIKFRKSKEGYTLTYGNLPIKK
jgi:hypothetical protein